MEIVIEEPSGVERTFRTASAARRWVKSRKLEIFSVMIFAEGKLVQKAIGSKANELLRRWQSLETKLAERFGGIITDMGIIMPKSHEEAELKGHIQREGGSAFRSSDRWILRPRPPRRGRT